MESSDSNNKDSHSYVTGFGKRDLIAQIMNFFV